MNILILAPFLPRPNAPSGNPRAVFDRVRLLSSLHNLTVATFIEPGERKDVAFLKALGIRVHGVIRDPKAGLTGIVLWRKRARLAAGLFNPRRPMLVQEFSNKRMNRLVLRLVSKERFDLILVEHSLMAQYIDHLDPQTAQPIILTEHDVRLAFPLEGVSGQERGNDGVKVFMHTALGRVERMKWRQYGRSVCLHATSVLVPSREDAEALAIEVPGLVPHVVPFGVDLVHSAESGTIPGIDATKESLLFVGNFDHPPNVDAALWLCGEIMPLIRRNRSNVELWLVGKNPTREVACLASPGVAVTGEVSSVVPYLRGCTLFVAPLRQGGGMRIKLIEAMGAGAAVVTTTLGAQGLGAISGQHLLVADDAGSFADAVLRVLDDPGLRERLRSTGQLLVNSASSEKERLELLNRILHSTIAKATKAKRSRA
ncbi:MAG: glycosyltransferase [Chloroflexia bacterium]